MIHCKGDTLEVSDLPSDIQQANPAPHPAPTIPTDERSRFVFALGQARGNRTKAARLLGMSRATFYRRLTELELPPS